MPTILITGANKGLGLGFTKRYAADGWRVLATCRQPDTATDLYTFAQSHDVHVRPLDVTDHASIDTLSATITGPIDILLNNAAVQSGHPQKFGHTDYGAWDFAFRTNVMGVMKMCEAFVPHVERGTKKLIVNVSSRTSSIANKTQADPDNTKGELHQYRSTKSALNMVSRCMAWELQPRGIAVVMLAPGWVRTDLGGPKARLSVNESIFACVPTINALTLADTGQFRGHDGSTVPW
jgi:NAD(P)-dependent dehydrogenase (short-subunit alcohol dehydrogenase family)